ncbi:hypothetical protein REPUB_Repub09cG0098800 [Reevesia pubescens]
MKHNLFAALLVLDVAAFYHVIVPLFFVHSGSSECWIPVPSISDCYSPCSQLGINGDFEFLFCPACLHLLPQSWPLYLYLFSALLIPCLPALLIVGFYQMAKLAITPLIVVAELIWYKKGIAFSKVIALTVVSIGVAVATVTDLQFSLFGACVALAWIIPSAVNKILWSNVQQLENWTALALMWKTTPITLFFLVFMIPLLDPPGMAAFNWRLSNTSAILLSAFLGFLLQWSSALTLGVTSAISSVVLG